MIDLENKVVIITGASSGFGEDAAWLFANEGCKVVLAARRVDRLQNLAAKIQNEGGEAIAIPMDITRQADIHNMVESAIALYGQIDILYNNAGIGRVDWFENHTVERDIHVLINVNLVGMMQVTRAVLPHMLKRREGHIINMISVSAFVSSVLIPSYTASKFGARAFTDSLRREVSPLGIKVSGIYPGPASTELGQHIGKNKAYGSVRGMFSGTRLTSEQVARRVVRLAQYPRRSVVMPWFYRIIFVMDTLFPFILDWGMYIFARAKHKPDEETQ